MDCIHEEETNLPGIDTTETTVEQVRTDTGTLIITKVIAVGKNDDVSVAVATVFIPDKQYCLECSYDTIHLSR